MFRLSSVRMTGSFLCLAEEVISNICSSKAHAQIHQNQYSLLCPRRSVISLKCSSVCVDFFAVSEINIKRKCVSFSPTSAQRLDLKRCSMAYDTGILNDTRKYHFNFAITYYLTEVFSSRFGRVLDPVESQKQESMRIHRRRCYWCK